MKQLIAVTGIALFCSSAMADQYVNGHVKSDGTYVPGYYRSTPNSNPYDNYSTKGNINPYTGNPGTQNPYPPQYPNTYQPQYSPYYTPPK